MFLLKCAYHLLDCMVFHSEDIENQITIQHKEQLFPSFLKLISPNVLSVHKM
jgi:hypothetical protein